MCYFCPNRWVEKQWFLKLIKWFMFIFGFMVFMGFIFQVFNVIDCCEEVSILSICLNVLEPYLYELFYLQDNILFVAHVSDGV